MNASIAGTAIRIRAQAPGHEDAHPLRICFVSACRRRSAACAPRAASISCLRSCNTNLAPPLAEHFSRILLVDGARLDPALMERERPDVVIQEFVERKLMCLDLREC
jgi:hypothetical protein